MEATVCKRSDVYSFRNVLVNFSKAWQFAGCKPIKRLRKRQWESDLHPEPLHPEQMNPKSKRYSCKNRERKNHSLDCSWESSSFFWFLKEPKRRREILQSPNCEKTECRRFCAQQISSFKTEMPPISFSQLCHSRLLWRLPLFILNLKYSLQPHS